MHYEASKTNDTSRHELRNAREELYKLAEERKNKQEERKKYGGQKVSFSSVKTKNKKNKKEMKKSKKKKSRRHKKQISDSERDSSSSSEKVLKKKKKTKKYSDPSSSSSDSEFDKGEWIEKEKPSTSVLSSSQATRDDWMTSNLLLPTYSKEKRDPKQDKKNIDDYVPSQNIKELNPYWKNGGTGLPAAVPDSQLSAKFEQLKYTPFQRPHIEDDDDEYCSKNYRRKNQESFSNSGWRKKAPPKESNKHSPKPSISSERNVKSGLLKSGSKSSPSNSDIEKEHVKPSTSAEISEFLTDQQINELGAKIVKAEIMGNDELATELKEKLERAREIRKNASTQNKKQRNQEVTLTITNDTGMQQPLQSRTVDGGVRGSQKNKKLKTDTHVDGERVRYFPDDDKYDLRRMFESEKFISASDNDAQFAKIAASASRGKNQDNLEDIFSDEVHKSMSEKKQDIRERDKAIQEHQRMERVLETCQFCIESPKMDRELIITMGTNAYLALPWHDGLVSGHCIITSISHFSCSTQLDEEVWEEITQFRKALTCMFGSRKQDVIFFEIARYIHKRPHMIIHCVPSKEFELAPMYFKKAIQESEREWSTNKQIIDLKNGNDVRRAIPRTLPYFWVNFGMNNGFAHVIEEQERFPSTFAQEVIAGILQLDPRVYRRPRKLHNPANKVQQFAEWWKLYDFTNKNKQ